VKDSRMTGKKTELIGFRVSPEEKIEADNICSDFGQTPGAVAGVLFDRFLKQRKKYGTRLVWPPEFNYYPFDSKTAQEKAESKRNT
jgi:hypothetical protein